MINGPDLLIVVARFYDEISEELIKGAAAQIDSVGGTYKRIDVPGALEIPQAIGYTVNSKASNLGSRNFDGYVALGCVIRGETTHYDHVCFESIHGVQALALRYSLALGNGILTCENREQAWARAAINRGNKGKAAAIAALEMIKVKQSLKEKNEKF